MKIKSVSTIITVLGFTEALPNWILKTGLPNEDQNNKKPANKFNSSAVFSSMKSMFLNPFNGLYNRFQGSNNLHVNNTLEIKESPNYRNRTNIKTERSNPPIYNGVHN